MPPTPQFPPTTADGWVQFAGEAQWAAAQFMAYAGAERAELQVRRPPAILPVVIALHDVTALDEFDGAPAGCHHVELAMGGRPTLQAVWPEAFSGAVVEALATTVDEVSTPLDSTPLDSTPLDSSPVGSSAVEPISIEPASAEPISIEPASAEPITVLPRSGPARRLTSVGTIGALALAGCGALIVGLLGLRDSTPNQPAETAVLTQTTIRGPVPSTTGAVAVTSTTSVDAASTSADCDGATPATIGEASAVTPTTAVNCEPG